MYVTDRAMSKSNRQYYGKKEKKVFSRLFLLSLNSYLLYLLLQLRFLLNLGHIFAGTLIFFILIGVIKNHKTLKNSTPPLDTIRLSTKYLKVNKIYIFASVIGLILATVVISQTMLLTSSYQKDTFNDIMKDADKSLLQFNSDSKDMYYKLDQWEKILPEIQSVLASNGFEYDYANTTLYYYLQLIVGVYMTNGSITDYMTTTLTAAEYNAYVYNVISELPSLKNLKYNSSQPLLLYWEDYLSSDFQDYINNNGVNLYMGSFNHDNSNYSVIKMNNVQIHRLSSQDYDYFSSHSVYNKLDFDFWSGVLLMNKTQLNTILTEQLNNQQIEYLPVNIISKVYAKLDALNVNDVDALINKIKRLMNDVQQWLYSVNMPDFYFYSPLYYSLQNYKGNVIGINVLLLLVTGPLIALSLFLVYFSLTLVEQRKAKIISIMKIRGSSRTQLNSMLVSEVLMSAIIAVLTGMILSIPWTALSLRAVDFFDFSGKAIPVIIPESWYSRLPLIGIILSIDINFSSIVSLSKIKIDEGEITEERKQPFWQRYYLDLILFGISIAFWIAIRLVNFNNQFVFLYILYSFGPFMLIIFLIGAPLVTARYFSSLIGRLSIFLWSNFTGLFALATRNMRKNRFSASKLAAFLLMGMMLSYIAVIIPSTFNGWNQEQSEYKIGADIYVEGIDMSNMTQWNLMNVDNVNVISPVIVGSFMRQINYGTMYYSVLGIDPNTFTDVAYWQSHYDTKSLDKIVGAINGNNTIGVQDQELLALGLSIGDTLTIPSSNSTNLKYQITTEFRYFPKLVDSLPGKDSSGNYYTSVIHMLMNYSAAIQIDTSHNLKRGAYIDVKNGANITAVAEQIKNALKYNSSISVFSIDDYTSAVANSPLTKILLSSLQGMLIITLLVSVIAVFYFSFVTLSERKKEIGVLRAIGMIRKQIFYLLVIESLILLGIGIILGGIAGYISVSNFFVFVYAIMGISSQVPPLNIVIPWRIIGSFTLFISVFSVIAAAIPARITANKQTGSILRAE